MPQPSLRELEQEVEAARTKLAGDLATLRSPSTAAEFTEKLKQEALETKDALLEKAKTSIQSSIESMIEDVKARAAANPTAALAIGAGLAWRLMRHPPIATVLVGAGLLSLFRTPPAHLHGRARDDYLSYAKNRLVEQASEVADVAKEKAAAIGETVSEKAAETAADIKDRVQDWTAQASSAAGEAAKQTKERASAMWDEAAEAVEQVGQSARATAPARMSGAGETVEQWWGPAQSSMNDAENRDTVLLGAAGLAVVAALGIACRRRLADQE
jgi:Skp family chaperone for outer membrane proteins